MSNKARSLFFLTFMVILSLSLTACGTAQQSTQVANNTEASASEKSVTIVIAEDPPSFNPMVADTGYDALVMELVLLGMTDIDPNGNIFAELATELPTLDNGNVTVDDATGSMSVTWKMRNDVQWQDGTPVTADDAVFTWEAISNPDTGSWIPGSDYIDSVEKVDQYSFVVNYNTIYPGYLTQFGGEQLAIWPAHYCKADQGFVSWDCGRAPLSDGPMC